MRALSRFQTEAFCLSIKKSIVDGSRRNAVPVTTLLHRRPFGHIASTSWSGRSTQFVPNLLFHSFSTHKLNTDADLNDHSTDHTKIATNFTSHWDSMFSCLKDFKAQHGHTLVPATYPENPQLGNWVDNNRQAYRMRFEAEKNFNDEQDVVAGSKKHIVMMTDEKIEALESVGFVWNVLDHAWNTRYEGTSFLDANSFLNHLMPKLVTHVLIFFACAILYKPTCNILHMIHQNSVNISKNTATHSFLTDTKTTHR
ncbi:hypothetical protein ACHAWX_000819 [Stephanocyclus meneghinianus]